MLHQKPLLTLSLNSFIKIYALDTAKQFVEVNRRLQQSGGYNFYRNLETSVRAHIKGKSSDEIEYILNSASRPDEVIYNKLAYEAFYKKFGKTKKISEFDKDSVLRLANGALGIRVCPTFMVESASGMSVYHFWTPQTPSMDAGRASIGCFILREAFRKSAPNYDYKIFDTVQKKVYGKISNTASVAVESLSRTIASWLEQSHGI